MRQLAASTLLPLALCGVLLPSQAASGGEGQVAPVVTATRVTLREVRAPGSAPLHLPGPLVERLLVDYELRGGTYSQPPLIPGSQAFLRSYLQEWGPTGTFSSEVSLTGEVKLLGTPRLIRGHSRIRMKAGEVVACTVNSSMKALPVEAAGGGFRWRVSYRIVVNDHPYRVEIDATVQPSQTKKGHLDLVAHFTGPFRDPAKKPAK